jgi:FlgD Ig-like domain
VVLRDSLKPQLVDVFFDGNHIQNGDYVSASPTIDINVRDDGALPILDTATVSISLDEKRIYYNLNTALSLVPGSTTKEMTVRFRPALDKGEHQLGLSVKDRSGNFFDSTEHVITFSVDPQLKVEELFNYPNPFATQTYFAFKLTQVPEELQIKIYTVAGRLIKAIKLTSAELVFGFNKIYWDGRDGDGDDIANGVYLYRLIAKGANQQIALTQKLVKMR